MQPLKLDENLSHLVHIFPTPASHDIIWCRLYHPGLLQMPPTYFVICVVKLSPTCCIISIFYNYLLRIISPLHPTITTCIPYHLSIRLLSSIYRTISLSSVSQFYVYWTLMVLVQSHSSVPYYWGCDLSFHSGYQTCGGGSLFSQIIQEKWGILL
jgi:hypothetical protein